MSSTRTVLRVFLASPGDLQEERTAVRDVVDEFNVSWADELGYQIELLGWEETVASYGRPQDHINRDVDRCDLFIGMIWKRWGTPPARDGRYSSGFQEEFERAIARRRRSHKPDISLYFKQVPDELKADPGDDLKKVQEFRERMISNKEILFQDTSTTVEMEKATRKCINEFVIRAKSANLPSESEDTRAKHVASEPEEVALERRDRALSPLSVEGETFLRNLVDSIDQGKASDTLSAFGVARFRLLANAISKPGNDELSLGVHDINVLFSVCTKDMKLGKEEIHCLLRLGLQHLAHENIPLWCWHAALSHSGLDPAILSSIGGVSDDEKIGAIRVLEALARELPVNHKTVRRDQIVTSWFSEGSSARVKNAALSYLSKMGTASDTSIAKREHDRSDPETSRAALECMVNIALRSAKSNEAQRLVLEYQFDSIDANCLHATLDGLENLVTDDLLIGLEHRNAHVRRRVLQVLSTRAALDRETLERLSEDREPSIRREAISALEGLGRHFTIEEAKGILVRPQQPAIPGLLAASGMLGRDRQGEGAFEQYELERLMKMSESDLTKKTVDIPSVNNPAYFARAERYFAKYSSQLRSDIDDRFASYFEEKTSRIRAMVGHIDTGEKLVKDTRELEDAYRKRLTRRGLDILCRANKHQDLKRIRSNLKSGYALTSTEDARYLGQHGEWADIVLLANSQKPVPRGLLGRWTEEEHLQQKISTTLLKMSRGHAVSDLFSLEVPTGILREVIGLCPASRFSKISQAILFGLLDHELAEVRKAASIKTVQSMAKGRIRNTLHEYVDGDRYRYYNVIHWLDLGASMSRDDARMVIRATPD